MGAARVVGAAGLVATLAACGGGGSGPSVVPSAAPPPTTLTAAPVFLDGATGGPVGATAVPAVPGNGQAVTVTAPGYLTRRQLFNSTPLQLWRATEDYVRQLAYVEFTDGSLRTIRWPQAFVVTLDGDLATNDAVVSKTRQVLAEVQRVTGLALTLGPNGACVIAIDPNIVESHDAVGLTRLRYQGPSIVSANLTFASRAEIVGGGRADYGNTLLHEMGHAIGLGHSADTRDVMTPGSGPGTRVAEFQEGEVTALVMIYRHRSPGNYFPDRDPGVSAAGRADAQPIRTEIVD